MSTQTTRRFTRVSALVAGGLLAFALSGCSALQGLLPQPAVERDAETQEIVEEGTADVFAITVGDCLNESTGEVVSEVPVVPCSEPHDEEVFYEFQMTGDVYPGDDAVQQEAFAQCVDAFDAFVGIAYEDSVLDMYPFTPTEAGWNEINDRAISCVIYDTAGPVTGTLEGAAR